MTTPDRPSFEELLRISMAAEDHGVDLDPAQLERYLQGDCSPDEARIVQSMLSRSPELRQIALQLSGAEASAEDRQAFDAVDPARLARQKQNLHAATTSRPSWTKRLRRWLWSPALGYAVAAVLAVFLLLPSSESENPSGAAYSYHLRPLAVGEGLRSGADDAPVPVLEIPAAASLFCPTIWIPESVEPRSVDELVVRVNGIEIWRGAMSAVMTMQDGSPAATVCIPVPPGSGQVGVEGLGPEGSLRFVSRLELRRGGVAGANGRSTH